MSIEIKINKTHDHPEITPSIKTLGRLRRRAEARRRTGLYRATITPTPSLERVPPRDRAAIASRPIRVAIPGAKTAAPSRGWMRNDFMVGAAV